MTSLFPYLILAVLFVRGITLEGSVQGIIYYLKPEFHRLLSAQVSHHLLFQTKVPQTPLCTGQSSSTTPNQSSTDSSLLRSVIIFYLKPDFHRLLSAQVSHHQLPQTKHKPKFHRLLSAQVSHHLLSQTRVPQTPLCIGQSSPTTQSQTRFPRTPLCTGQSYSTTSHLSSTDPSLHRSVIIYYGQ